MFSASEMADIHLAPADRLAVRLRLVDEFEHRADDNRAGQLAAVDVFLFQTDANERRLDVFGRGIRWNLDELPQPGDWDAHQSTIPNCLEKRISPSTMSRMSFMSLRNCSVRSIPIPKAKPW